jgi:phage baseplate assembly protein W
MSYPNRIDTPELTRIKNNFALRDRFNIENRETLLREKRNPQLFFDSSTNSLGDGALQGLSYPLKLDGRGGVSLSSGTDRVGQAIQEVLETRIGERVGNPFMGTRELLFDTLSEDVEAQGIKKQILNAVPYLEEDTLNVSVSIGEDGTCYITVRYAIPGTGNTLTVRSTAS